MLTKNQHQILENLQTFELEKTARMSSLLYRIQLKFYQFKKRIKYGFSRVN